MGRALRFSVCNVDPNYLWVKASRHYLEKGPVYVVFPVLDIARSNAPSLKNTYMQLLNTPATHRTEQQQTIQQTAQQARTPNPS